MTGLDKIDSKILKILQENGRITNIQLSSDIGLSPAPTLERVRKLEQSGFIRNYHAIVDEEMVGLGLKVMVLIHLNYQKTDAINSFLKQIMKIDEITECYHSVGFADFILKVIVRNSSDLEKLMVEKIGRIQEIAQITVSTVLKTHKQSMVLPIPY